MSNFILSISILMFISISIYNILLRIKANRLINKVDALKHKLDVSNGRLGQLGKLKKEIVSFKESIDQHKLRIKELSYKYHVVYDDRDKYIHLLERSKSQLTKIRKENFDLKEKLGKCSDSLEQTNSDLIICRRENFDLRQKLNKSHNDDN